MLTFQTIKFLKIFSGMFGFLSDLKKNKRVQAAGIFQPFSEAVNSSNKLFTYVRVYI